MCVDRSSLSYARGAPPPLARRARTVVLARIQNRTSPRPIIFTGAGAPPPARAIADASRQTARHGRGRSSLGKPFDRPQSCFPHLHIIQAAFDQAIQPVDLSCATDRDELDFLCVARLEADGGAGGDVEPHAVGRRAIEREIAVELEKMKMRS